jgi:putative membrane protein
MHTVANVAVSVVALIHVAIAVIEMLLFAQPKVYARLERFAFTPAEAAKVAPIVANAGLYNLFIAAGLAWGVYSGQAHVAVFFLLCVAVAGLFGAITLKATTLMLQTVPAALALLAVWAAHRPL